MSGTNSQTAGLKCCHQLLRGPLPTWKKKKSSCCCMGLLERKYPSREIEKVVRSNKAVLMNEGILGRFIKLTKDMLPSFHAHAATRRCLAISSSSNTSLSSFFSPPVLHLLLYMSTSQVSLSSIWTSSASLSSHSLYPYSHAFLQTSFISQV